MTSTAAKAQAGELTSINPATLEEVGRIAVTTSMQLDGMVDAAHRRAAPELANSTEQQSLPLTGQLVYGCSLKT